MSKEFEDTRNQLVAAGFNIIKQEYNDSDFGSWHITLNTIPNRRIIWEGIDCVLRVEEETNEFFNESLVWKTILITKKLKYEEIAGVIREIIGTPE